MNTLESILNSSFIEQAKKLLEKHTIGTVSDPEEEQSTAEKNWELAYSNLSKITAQLVFELTLKYFKDTNAIENFKQ